MRALATCALFLGACQYKGAIFAEYQHMGLGIRAAPEQGSPVDLEVGSDRAVIAFIPKRERGDNKGEATSIVSWNFLRTTANPGSKELLKVDAGFMSGTAANVLATASDSKNVKLMSGQSTVATFRANGSSSERLTEALSAVDTSIYGTPTAREYDQLFEKLKGNDRALGAIAESMGGAFKTRYDQLAGSGAATAFLSAKNQIADDETAFEKLVSLMRTEAQR